MAEVTFRAMRLEDVAACEAISAEAFLEVDRRRARRHDPEAERRSPTRARDWIERTSHTLRTDPGGCWVADLDGDLLGFATSIVREGIWLLATFAVRPGAQGNGLGTALLEVAGRHGRGCLRGMLAASSDPGALRAYHRAGFTLHPQMHLTGTVDRAALPVVDRVRDATPADVDLMDSVDRSTRGAGHGPDHAWMLERWTGVVTDSTRGSGYAILRGSEVALLAATSRRVATDLLWECLARCAGEATIGHVTAANAWAVDVGMAARLRLDQEGYLGLRGMRPPTPYLHHGALL